MATARGSQTGMGSEALTIMIDLVVYTGISGFGRCATGAWHVRAPGAPGPVEG